jgi:hypothetical protein
MSDPVVIPQSELPAAPPPVDTPALPPEIAYLQQHGMEGEANSLQVELENLLRARDTAPAITPTQAPITQTPAPVPVAPTETPPAPQTAQEKALDPYAVDGGEGPDDTAIVVDDQGRTRDAATGKYVSIKALHHERNIHKQTRSELQQLREQNIKAEERLAILTEILNAEERPVVEQPAAPVDERPELTEPVDPEKDIFAWAKQQQDFAQKQNEYIKKLEEKLSGTENVTKQQLEAMRADQAIRSDVTAFHAKQPDFLKAYNHLRTIRNNALEALGFSDEKARGEQIAREERAVAMEALKNRRSYAETLYRLAQAHGYAKAADPAPEPVAAPPSPAPAPTPPSVDPAAAAKIAAIKNGKDVASPTLNGVGGTGGEGLTVRDLANMSENDFLNLAGKLGKAKMDALLRNI